MAMEPAFAGCWNLLKKDTLFDCKIINRKLFLTGKTRRKMVRIVIIYEMIIKNDILSVFQLSIWAYCVYYARFVISTGATGFEL